MKTLRVVLLLVVGALIAYQPAEAQLRKRLQERAKKRAQERAERKANELADRGVDRVMDSAEERIENAAAASWRSMVNKRTSNNDEPIELGAIEAEPRDAPLVQYRIVTRMGSAGMGAMLARFGGASNSVETYFLSATRQRQDSDDFSTFVDAAAGAYTMVNHEKQRYFTTTLGELMTQFEGQAQQTQAQMDQAMSDAENSGAEVQTSFDIQVIEGKDEMVDGVMTKQTILVLRSDYEGTAQDDQGQVQSFEGTFYTVVDQRLSTQVAGYATIEAFQRRMAETVGANLRQTEMGSMFMQDPRMNASLQEAGKKMAEQQGLPVRSRTFFVQVPAGQELDLDPVLATPDDDPNAGQSSLEDWAVQMEQNQQNQQNGGMGVTEQRVMFSVLSRIGDLTAGGFEASFLEVDPSYTEVDSMQALFME